jgi:hypothetical protein
MNNPITPSHVPIRTARNHIVVSKTALSTMAFGYVRLSQDKRGSLSVERQTHGIKEANRINGLPEPYIFIDDDNSGQNNDRDGFRQLLKAFAEHPGAFCTIETGDRAFRSLLSYAEFQEAASRYEIRLYNRRGPIAPEMLPIEATLSVSEINKLRLRSEYRKRQLRREGLLIQGPGAYALVQEDNKFIPHPELKHNVDLVYDLAEAYVLPSQIVRILYERKIPSPSGKEMWSCKRIMQMLTNPVYAGFTAYWNEVDD